MPAAGPLGRASAAGHLCCCIAIALRRSIDWCSISGRPETKHGSVEGKPRDDTGRILGRQNGETGTDRFTKDTANMSSGANFIFTFSDAMG